MTKKSQCVSCHDAPAAWLGYCRPCARGMMARLAGLGSIAAGLSCTAPDVAVQVAPSPAGGWVDVDAKTLCVPAEESTGLGYVAPAGGCGQDLVWPCERRATCSAPAGCVCKCDVGRDDDCAGAWLTHWYPGAVVSAQCGPAGRCAISR